MSTATATKSKQQIFDEMSLIWPQFVEAHNSTKKKDLAQSRKLATSLKKLVTPYNKASVEEQKASK